MLPRQRSFVHFAFLAFIAAAFFGPATTGASPAPEVSVAARYDRPLRFAPAQFERECGKFKRIDVVRFEGAQDEAKLHDRAMRSLGEGSEFLAAHLLGAHVLVFLASADAKQPYLLADVFHFDDSLWSEKAELFVKKKLGQMEPSFLPHIATIRNSDSIVILTRAHPDQIPIEQPRGVSDRCLDAVAGRFTDALKQVSPLAERSPAASVDLSFYVHGKAFDSLLENDLTDDAIAQLNLFPELEQVALSGPRLTSGGYARVKSLPALRVLSFGPGVVGDAGIAGLQSLSNLRVVRLGHSRITDHGLDALSGLANLEDVSLRGNEISGTGLKNLSAAQQLKSLGLNWCPVTDAGLASLPVLPALTTLFLADTKVTDSGLKSLGRLPALRYVVLRRTQITDRGLLTLAKLPKLEAIDVTNTRITKRGVEDFTKVNPNVLVLTSFSPAGDQNKLAELERKWSGEK